MFTNVEGEWDEVMNLVKACVEKVAEGTQRVSVVVKIDYRPGFEGAITKKLESLNRHLG